MKTNAFLTAIGSSVNIAENYNTFILVYLVVFSAFLSILYLLIKISSDNIKASDEKHIIFGILITGLLFRIFTAPWIEGFSVDINCFKAWSLTAAKDLPGFYNSGLFCDYPPVYIYVLFILGKLAGIQMFYADFTLLVKLPSIIADVVTAYMLYNISKDHLPSNMRFFVTAAYVFSPVVLIDSTIWGQVDSFFTMLVVAALILLTRGKLTHSAVLFTLSVLMKPQGIFFVPVLLFELIRLRKIRMFLMCSLYSVITALVVSAPFSFTQEPLWLVKLFTNTASQYPYASLNAFNLFSLFGANLENESNTMFLFSYHNWGLLLDVLLFIFTLLLHIKGKFIPALPILAALMLNAGAFMISVKMHERYMYPAIALSILLFIFTKDKRILYLHSALTLTVFVNIHMVLFRMLATGNPHIEPVNQLLRYTSLANTAIFVYLTVISADMAFKGRFFPINPANPNKSPAHLPPKKFR